LYWEERGTREGDTQIYLVYIVEGDVKQRGAPTRREAAGEGGDIQDNTRHNVSVGGTREDRPF
jgi:hypothetical protein